MMKYVIKMFQYPLFHYIISKLKDIHQELPLYPSFNYLELDLSNN